MNSRNKQGPVARAIDRASDWGTTESGATYGMDVAARRRRGIRHVAMATGAAVAGVTLAAGVGVLAKAGIDRQARAEDQLENPVPPTALENGNIVPAGEDLEVAGTVEVDALPQTPGIQAEGTTVPTDQQPPPPNP